MNKLSGRRCRLVFQTNRRKLSLCYNFEQRGANLPAVAKMCDDKTVSVNVCHVRELPENSMKEFELFPNTTILLIKQNNEIRAVGSRCPHYGAPLHKGVLGEGRIRCPWHGACFNIASGDIEDFPGLDSLPCFKVEVNSSGQVTVLAKSQDLVAKRLKNMIKRDIRNYECFVILGGGPAGAVCAETLRQEGFSGRIVLVCKEAYLPYDRVKLTKSTALKMEEIQFRRQEFYDQFKIENLMSTEAVEVNCDARTVYLSNFNTLKYNKLFIATGCSAKKPLIKGIHLKGVVTIREFKDFEQITQMINSRANVVCLGSSFIALESAQNWLSQVKTMTVVSSDKFPLMGSFGSVIGERILRFFREQGVTMIMNNAIVEICGDSNHKIKRVVLKDGTILPCDILIVGTGCSPNSSFLIGSGLPINADGSIRTDEYLKSLVDNVYVGGDIANSPVFVYYHQRAHIGHYQLAQYHGRIAAINMIGKATQELRSVPYFFSVLFGRSFRYSGYGVYTDVIIEGDLENLKFVAYFTNDHDRVVAVASCGRDPVVSQFAELQSQGKRLYRADLRNPSGWTKLLNKATK